MQAEACAADVGGLLVLSRPPAFLGELGEGDRRRVPLDPASKVIDPLTIGHCGYGTVTVEVVVPERPSVSVTVNRTV
jgi:hypothetical protein